MPPLLADESFRRPIIVGLRQRLPNLDIVRVQEVGLKSKPDPLILEWAAQTGRVVLTHDVDTMIDYAYTRLRTGLLMPGLLVVPQTFDVGDAIDAIELMLGASFATEWAGQVRYVEK